MYYHSTLEEMEHIEIVSQAQGYATNKQQT
jgi:hypothetical protein